MSTREARVKFSRLYRAYVSFPSPSHPELAVFVEAPSRDAARQRICELVALITRRTADDVGEALYNLYSAQELLDKGLSEPRELRLFECGWSQDATTYIDAPLALVSNPAPLLEAWVRTRTPIAEPCVAAERLPSAVRRIRSCLKIARAVAYVCAATLRAQAVDRDTEVALSLQRCVGDELDRQIEIIDRLLGEPPRDDLEEDLS